MCATHTLTGLLERRRLGGGGVERMLHAVALLCGVVALVGDRAGSAVPVCVPAHDIEIIVRPGMPERPPVHRYDVEVGRLRKNLCFENGLEFFVSGDQLLRGAALNAVLVAEAMDKNGALKPKVSA